MVTEKQIEAVAKAIRGKHASPFSWRNYIPDARAAIRAFERALKNEGFKIVKATTESPK